MSKDVFKTGIMFIIFVFFSGGALFAVEFGDKIDKADDCYQQGRYIDAVDNLKDAVKIAWEAAALSARNINFVEDGNSGFQKFVVREDRPFAGGENIIIYLEPVGFSVEEREDSYFAHLETDYELLDSESRELAKEQEFGDFEIEDTTFFTDISLNLNFSFTGLIDGNYTLKIIIRDVLSGEEYILTKDFKFAQNPDE